MVAIRAMNTRSGKSTMPACLKCWRGSLSDPVLLVVGPQGSDRFVHKDEEADKQQQGQDCENRLEDE